ncbi:bifunctional riboflavin kinase/FAD synthetase [Salinithrix halophila]|uniref:Riboflavin biosynthesis protein n=1 Tax=Salinithrix halophila TaxID=1485204 RepID=A0ABV8JGP1_9BACL
METFHLTYPLTDRTLPGPVALAIGYFDGVHLGHQAVIENARRLAEETGAAVGVMTFHPHPREVLGKGEMSHYLTPLPEKLRQFQRLGVDRTYVMNFDLEFASLSKEAFVEQVLLPLGVTGAACGFNFSFGRGAGGQADDLVRLGKGRYQAAVTLPVYEKGLPLSSTRLRKALSQGEVEESRDILGRPYTLRGRVVEGDQRGRAIGFPTANLQLTEPYTVPAEGVYAVRVCWGSERADGMMNIGYRPTFKDSEPRQTLEVHLFDREDNLYGEELEVSFLHRLREETRFASVEALIDQLKADEQKARAWLRQNG